MDEHKKDVVTTATGLAATVGTILAAPVAAPGLLLIGAGMAVGGAAATLVRMFLNDNDKK